MDNRELIALFDQEQRIEIDYPDMRKEVLPHLVRFTRPAPGANFILWSRLDEASADAVIAAQVADLKPRGQKFSWKVYDHDTPPDLKLRLAAHGLVQDEEPGAVMVLDLQSAPAALLAPAAADVRPITTRAGLQAVVQVMVAVYGGNYDWIYDRLGSHLEMPGYLSVYAAYAQGQPACAAWIYFHAHSQFASLWGGSTVEQYRRRGLYTALLATRGQEAVRRGYRFLTIDASPMSRPIVARHGFQLLTYACDYAWKPKGES